MNNAIFLTQAVNLILIGALPQIFFKRGGRLNLMWWATALPFGVAGLMLMAGLTGIFTSGIPADSFYASVMSLAGLVLSIGSIALIFFTLGTHEKRISLWHQTNDAPEHIVTHGAYKYVRHPFYSAFLLGLLGIAMHVPHIVSLMVFVYAALILTYTAKREEHRLSSSVFGEEYDAYKKVTGRFVPKRGVRHA